MSIDHSLDKKNQAGGIFLIACAGVYISQTLVTTLATQSLPSLLRASGAPLQLVGLSYLFLLPWVVKFLWSPAVERMRRPATGNEQSRNLIVIGQVALAVILAVPVLISHNDHALTQILGLLLLLAALLSASVDIATDGMMIDQLRSSGSFCTGNMVQVGGSYLGVMLGGGGFLLLSSYLSWPTALLLTSLLLLLISLPILSLRPVIDTSRPATQTGSRPSLRHALKRREIRVGLGLVLLMGAGIRTAFGMIGPLLLDQGISMTQLGWLFGTFSVVAGLLGTLAGGWLSHRLAPWHAVAWVLALQALFLAAFIPALSFASATHFLIAVCGMTFAAMAAGFVVIYSALMRLTSPTQSGVDFTLFQCADALIAMIGGITGGFLAGQLGYLGCFAIAAGLSLLATIVVFRTLIFACPVSLTPSAGGDACGSN